MKKNFLLLSLYLTVINGQALPIPSASLPSSTTSSIPSLVSYPQTVTVKVYLDKNLNGKYDEDIDTPLSNFPISVYSYSTRALDGTYYTNSTGEVKIDINEAKYIVANTGMYQSSEGWNKAVLTGIDVSFGDAYCDGEEKNNYSGYCVGGYNGTVEDPSEPLATFDENSYTSFAKVYGGEVTFLFSPFVVVNSKDTDSMGSLYHAIKNAIWSRQNATIEIFNNTLDETYSSINDDKWFVINGLDFEETLKGGCNVIVIDGTVRDPLSGEPIETASGYLGLKNDLYQPELPPEKLQDNETENGQIKFKVYNDTADILVGTGPDAIPSYVANKWIEENNLDIDNFTVDEDTITPVKKPNLVIDNTVVINTNQDSTIIFENVSIPDGIVFKSPGFLKNSYVGVYPDGTISENIPSKAVEVVYSDTYIKISSDFNHNLIAGSDYGIYICAPEYSRSYENNLFIENNTIANLNNSTGYAVFLCDRNKNATAVDIQRNIFIRDNLIYTVHGGIYAGNANNHLAIHDNNIALLVYEDKNSFDNDVDNYLNSTKKFSYLNRVGIMLNGTNEDVGIAFNYIYNTKAGIYLRNTPAIECDPILTDISDNITVFRNFSGIALAGYTLYGFFNNTLFLENIAYNTAQGFFITPLKSEEFTSNVTVANNTIFGNETLASSNETTMAIADYTCPSDIPVNYNLIEEVLSLIANPNINAPLAGTINVLQFLEQNGINPSQSYSPFILDFTAQQINAVLPNIQIVNLASQNNIINEGSPEQNIQTAIQTILNTLSKPETLQALENEVLPVLSQTVFEELFGNLHPVAINVSGSSTATKNTGRILLWLEF